LKAGIRQISEITGFSAATVSNALNQKKGVNKKTSEEIFRVAREIGYIDDSTITKIRLVIYKKNGLIVNDTPYFTLLVEGIEQECRESGYELSISNLNEKHEDYEEQVWQLVNEPGTAIILLGSELSQEDVKRYKAARCPILLLGYWSYDMAFHGLMINNEDSIRMAMSYLIKNGHKKIGYLKSKYRILDFEQRQVGYQLALQEFNIPYNQDFIVELGTTMNEACREMLEYLDRTLVPVTAYIAENDRIALGAMKALIERGYQIPKDVSMIGFDDLPFCDISSPRLTSFRVPKQDMGRLAVRKVIDMIKQGDRMKTKLQVCTEFIERDSVYLRSAKTQERAFT
jgi:DNA-binding LacI/PurR family transcriptional regulator